MAEVDPRQTTGAALSPASPTVPQINVSGWTSHLARVGAASLLFLLVSGFLITFAPFHPITQWTVLVHTVVGLVTLLPLGWYVAVHWSRYGHYRFSHIVLLGYVGLAALAVCAVSGVVLTWQGLFAIKTMAGWRQVHLISTFAVLISVGAHVLLLLPRLGRRRVLRPAAVYLALAAAGTILGMAAIAGLTHVYSGTPYVNELPADYNYLYGPERPFAPSLARTQSGGGYDSRSLSGSESCGTSGCHAQILAEWKPSAHRYAAMDTLFQGIQNVMAEQNGPESTRYCGGCHDPISLFSGTKNIFVDDLTGLHGYNEGVSCLACHAIRETDLRGNANYVISQPRQYLWQWSTEGLRRHVRDFLIRTYPGEHGRLSKRLFKAPEYCAACHKQFIDQEVNQVGWVQLQNQYDNWAASHWNVKGDPTRTVECRECHMPLVDSTDPAAGDTADYNRTPSDGKHRSHRFIASNILMPQLLELEGWEEQVRLTEAWLAGKQEIPEIRDKWASGPIVGIEIFVPESVRQGDPLPVRVVFTSNKVGHDFPTGPLDIIQSWLELRITDHSGNVLFTSGTRDAGQFIEPGTFMFKAEPIDQYGNLIDRHNLWEMVGVRFRRALFPGYSDAVDFSVDCTVAVRRGRSEDPGDENELTGRLAVTAPEEPGCYHITAILQYRKVDQFLLNYLLGEESGVTAPVTEIARASATVQVTR